jgi:carbonic anhydrase/acetyltransferase-like protein (isoleucine patch superfamily)
VPPRTLWAGLPAKQRRELGDQDREHILMYARNYLDYTATYLQEQKQWDIQAQKQWKGAVE